MKYKNALYPDKINDLIDNEGNISEEVLGGALKTINGTSLLGEGDIDTKELPALPEDAASKTYVLKAVNGVLTWVE